PPPDNGFPPECYGPNDEFYCN
ncbi:MAG: hypothetical protein K0Q69_2388, partial [Devosia sp.]|nr:hypothetical protein [Devosia sp.]